MNKWSGETRTQLMRLNLVHLQSSKYHHDDQEAETSEPGQFDTFAKNQARLDRLVREDE